MADQIFTAPVGQVAAGDIRNHASRWALCSLKELMKYEKMYARDRRKALLSQYVNKAAALLLIALAIVGWWGSHMIQTDGLNGVIAPELWAIVAAFAVVVTGACFWLHLIREAAKTTVTELDAELREIRGEIRFKKSKR